MSQPAEKRPSAPGPQPEENTGRYAIDAVRRGMLLPPRNGETEEVVSLSLEELGAALENDAPRTQPPPTPRGLVSGVFSNKPAAPPRAARNEGFEDPGLAALADSLQPYYRDDEQQIERAALEIEDLSLRLDNPLVASSLVPPRRQPPSAAKWASAGAAVAVLAMAAGLVLVRAMTQAPAERAPVADVQPKPSTPASVPSAASHAPVVPVVTEAAPAPAAAAPTRTTTAPQLPRERAQVPVAAVSKLAAPVANAKSAPPAPAPAVPPTAAEPAATDAPTTATAAPAAIEPVALAAALPETPSRADVVAGFEAIRAQLEQCAAGKHGVAKIEATIANSGRVSYALIDGQFRGSPEGSCMARAVRSARFSQFSQPNLKVSFPIAF